jgi:hypothetical protein
MTGARDGPVLIETGSTGEPQARVRRVADVAPPRPLPWSRLVVGTPSAPCRLNRTERFVGAARSGPSACKPRSTSVRGLSGCGVAQAAGSGAWRDGAG